jgi:hypothetical protein
MMVILSFIFNQNPLIIKLIRVGVIMRSQKESAAWGSDPTSFVTILTAVTDALIGAEDATLVALAVLLQASRFFAMTSLGVRASFFEDLRFESMRVPLND